jgi:hypothetical protein
LPSITFYLVVFDPEPGMTVWEYTPERLEAAATLLATRDYGSRESIATIERIRQVVPEWIVPMMYNSGSLVDRTQAFLDEVSVCARTEEERAWLDAYRDIPPVRDQSERHAARRAIEARLAAIGRERRQASALLERARVELEKDPSRLTAWAKGN